MGALRVGVGSRTGRCDRLGARGCAVPPFTAGGPDEPGDARVLRGAATGRLAGPGSARADAGGYVGQIAAADAQHPWLG